jgi:hypothetical protein
MAPISATLVALGVIQEIPDIATFGARWINWSGLRPHCVACPS